MKNAVVAAGVLVLGSALYTSTMSVHLWPAHASPAQLVTSAEAAPQHPTILFVGDMMFDRYIRTVAERRGGDFLFSCVDSLFEQADFVVGNLEGPITTSTSTSVGSVMGTPDNYVFTFPVGTAALLAKHHVGAVTLGNNHIGNQGVDGLRSTEAYLDAAGVGHFGGLVGEEPVFRVTLSGVPFSFVSYNQFGGSTSEVVAETVRAEHAAGRTVIVFAHWGEEYTDASAQLRPAADLFVQSGAAFVVGSHPHIVYPSETIGGVPVYYSLGNFIFDQYWDQTVTSGLAVRATFSPEGVSTKEYPIALLRTGLTCPRESTLIIPQ